MAAKGRQGVPSWFAMRKPFSTHGNEKSVFLLGFLYIALGCRFCAFLQSYVLWAMGSFPVISLERLFGRSLFSSPWL
jgi:hypothetical protein